MALKLNDKLASGIRAHGEAAYPHECCGALLGCHTGADRETRALLPLLNRRTDSPQNRFSVSAADVRAAEQAAAAQGLDLIGWYHSHPDHPAQPSDYDREHAWPWYSYVIVSVHSGHGAELTAWRLAEDRSAFEHEPLESAASISKR